MKSNKYKNWLAILDLKTCLLCRAQHGQVYLAEEAIDPEPPLHIRCRYTIEWLTALYTGTATDKGENGADWWLRWVGRLPDYYITSTEAEEKGYIPILGNLSSVAPGKMLTKGQYANRNGHLPSVPGRLWYEADINYTDGYRGGERILFSNDGLMFVTYDHYKTFQVVV